MGEHLPCKQGVKSSNLSISIQSGRAVKRTKVPNYAVNLKNYVLSVTA